MKIVEDIRAAFKGRKRPMQLALLELSGSDIGADAEAFARKEPDQVCCEDLRQHPDAILGFTPEGFFYYLPAFLTAVVRERCLDLFVISSIVEVLDRSNVPNSWDAFFVERWGSLNEKECSALQAWLLWLAENEWPEMFEGQLSRAFDTLELISNLRIARPLSIRGKKR